MMHIIRLPFVSRTKDTKLRVFPEYSDHESSKTKEQEQLHKEVERRDEAKNRMHLINLGFSVLMRNIKLRIFLVCDRQIIMSYHKQSRVRNEEMTLATKTL
jgi:hypothetical protein